MKIENFKLQIFNLQSICVSLLTLATCLIGCERSDSSTSSQTVVLYTSVDQPIAQPIIRVFEQQNPDIKVILQTDAEANKTVGLVERIRAEKDNPQADVWWGNEPFHSVRLAEEGLLVAYDPPSAQDIPEQFKDAQRRWAGNGLRARVIAVRQEEGQPYQEYPPTGLFDLHHPDLAGKVAMARPTAGTTGSHVAALYVLWGDEKADAFFHSLRKAGIKLLGGNGPVAEAVGQGHFLVALTDNDDVTAARREGGNIRAVLPNQESFGTLALPTTVGLVNGSKNREAARKLIDYLLTRGVEDALMKADFAGWSVRDGDDRSIRAMKVDYAEVARKMPDAIRRATAILEGRE